LSIESFATFDFQTLLITPRWVSVAKTLFLCFCSARYLGPAITEGAVYLCSTDGSRTSVFCCKGNMKGKRVAEMYVHY